MQVVVGFVDSRIAKLSTNWETASAGKKKKKSQNNFPSCLKTVEY